MRDDDGFDVKSGDWISFSYGIPPVRVDARVSWKDGKLVATCLGNHRPKQVPLHIIRQYVEQSLSPQGKVIWRVKFIDTLAAEYFCLSLIDQGMDQVGLISLGRVLLIFDKEQ